MEFLKRRGLLFLLLGVVSAFAILSCSEDIPYEKLNSMLQTVFDPSTGEIPFPNDVLYETTVEGYEDGEPKDTGHVAIPETGNAAMDSLIAGLNTLDGFSAWIPPYLGIKSIEGAELDESTLSKDSVKLFSLDRDMFAGLIEGVSQGKTLEQVMADLGISDFVGLLLALDIEMPEGIPYNVVFNKDFNRIEIQPLTPLKEHRQYMVVVVSGKDEDGNVVGLKDTNGTPVQPAPFFYMLRQKNPLCENGKSTTSLLEDEDACSAEQLRAVYNSIIPILEDAGNIGIEGIESIPRNQIVMLWTFKTETATAPLVQLRAGLMQGVIQHTASVEKSTVVPSELFGSEKTALDSSAIAFEGKFKSLNFLQNDTGDGYATFLPSADSPLGIAYEEDEVPFLVLIPTQPSAAPIEPKADGDEDYEITEDESSIETESETEIASEEETELEIETTEAEEEISADGDEEIVPEYEEESLVESETDTVAETETVAENETGSEGEEPQESEIKGIIIFAHGLNGSRYSVYNYAKEALDAGFIVVSMDEPFFGDRKHFVGEGDDQKPLSIFTPNLFATRDNIRQAVLDFVQLLNSIQDSENGIGKIIAQYAPNGYEHIGLVGQSLGGIIGGVVAGIEDRIQSYVLSAPGAGWPKILLDTADKDIRDPLIFALSLAGINEGTPEFDKFMGTTGWVLESADPIMFLKHAIWRNELFSEPIAQKPRAVLVQMMQNDPTIPNSSTQLLLSAASNGDVSWLAGDEYSATCSYCKAFMLDPDSDAKPKVKNGIMFFSAWAPKDGDEWGKHSFLTAGPDDDEYYQAIGHDARMQTVEFIMSGGSEL